MPSSKTRTSSGRTFFSGSNFGGSSPTGSNKRTSAGGSKPTGAYKNVGCTLQQKISSFKTLYNQTTGGAATNRPSPTTINTFANWVNKGAVIQTVSPTQLNKWCNNFKGTKPATKKWNVNTASGCKQFLCQRFGKSTIKAVTKAKNGAWLVATAPVVKGRTFNFPH